MAKLKKTAVEIALELLEVRRQKNELERINKVLSEELKKRIKKGEQQESYKIRIDWALDVKDEVQALPWALAHQCVKIDVPAVDSCIKNNRYAMPDGFSLVEKEKLVEAKD